MKVIKDEVKKGPLKGVTFLENAVSIDEQMRIGNLAMKAYDHYSENGKIDKEDIINLKNNAEISTARISGELMILDDGRKFEICNKLNDEKTEWVMSYIFYDNDDIIFVKNDLEESLEFIYKGNKVIDLIINSKNFQLLTRRT